MCQIAVRLRGGLESRPVTRVVLEELRQLRRGFAERVERLHRRSKPNAEL
jgi:hypothetical protein